MKSFTEGTWKATYSEVLKQYQGHEAIIHAGEFIKDTNLCTGDYIAMVHTMEDARLMAHSKEMYERLQDVMDTINGVLPYVPDGIDDLHLQYDKNSLQVEADLIDDLLTLIDGEEAQS